VSSRNCPARLGHFRLPAVAWRCQISSSVQPGVTASRLKINSSTNQPINKGYHLINRKSIFYVNLNWERLPTSTLTITDFVYYAANAGQVSKTVSYSAVLVQPLRTASQNISHTHHYLLVFRRYLETFLFASYLIFLRR